MEQLQTTVTLPGIQKIVQQIVDRFRPQQVILFGSYAYGQPTADSDVDLLVVVKTEETPLHTAARISASVDHPFPLDILVIRPPDLIVALQEKNIFETEVVNKGVIVYRSPKSFVDTAVHASTSPSRLRSARTGSESARPERSAAKSKGARHDLAPHFIKESYMKQRTREWISKAEGDWIMAQRERRAADSVWDGICFHAQQRAEKYIKAFLFVLF